jgi:hypothetical protein
MPNFISFDWRKLRADIRARLRRCDRILILAVPNELLLMIFGNLETADQACLALSCQVLYHKVGPLVLGHPDLSLLIAPGPQPLLGFSPRMELLLRLEKDHYRRWLYCATCRKLHSPSEFEGMDRINNALAYPSEISPRRRCTSTPGIVELCPCIQLTFRQKVRLIRYLKALSHGNDSQDSPSIHYGRLRAFKANKGGPETARYLTHGCSILDHPLGVIKITINAYLDKWDHFVVQAKYEVLSSRPINPRELNRGRGCPHYRTYGHGTRSILWHWPHGGGVCFFCQLACYGCSREKGPFQTAAQCRRDLGGSAWPPDHTWDIQCIRQCYLEP